MYTRIFVYSHTHILTYLYTHILDCLQYFCIVIQSFLFYFYFLFFICSSYVFCFFDPFFFIIFICVYGFFYSYVFYYLTYLFLIGSINLPYMHQCTTINCHLTISRAYSSPPSQPNYLPYCHIVDIDVCCGLYEDSPFSIILSTQVIKLWLFFILFPNSIFIYFLGIFLFILLSSF